MKTPGPEMVPRRTSLLSQAVEIIRCRIQDGSWGEYLPSELELARRMQIGRNTVRKALVQLTDEGLIQPGRSGKRRRITTDRPTVKRTVSGDHPIFFLSPLEADRLPPHTLKQLDETRLMLNESGLRLQIISSKAFRLKQPEKAMQRLIDEHPASAWILHRTTDKMQRVFMQRHIPAVILGMPHAGIHIPAVTPDLEAAARHATGVLMGKGHRRICFLRAQHGLAGSEQARKGFESAFDLHPDEEGYHPMIKELPSEVDLACRSLKRIFRAAQPPTALLVEQVVFIPTIMTYLARLGLNVPDDVSLVSLFEDAVLDYLVPSVAHYRINTRLEVKKMVQSLLLALERGPVPTGMIKLMPDFEPGNSIASQKL
ncbi:MAG: DNA-binding LacI/PurR family transcriptional regulator [Kiritimatiellia bacterium]|jgi:DNA-binding LacI/PurR family transcriptional regulator